MHDQAGTLFNTTAQRFGSLEARAERYIWEVGRGEDALAERESGELAHARKHMARHVRAVHADLFKQIDAASAQRERNQAGKVSSAP